MKLYIIQIKFVIVGIEQHIQIILTGIQLQFIWEDKIFFFF